MIDLTNVKVAVIGLGYVGLPLAVEFGKQRKTVGLDVNLPRISALKKGQDATLEVSSQELQEAPHLSYTAKLDDIRDCNVYIVTVPTPVDIHKRPDITPLIKASQTVGSVISKGDIVIYESTVYPGATEDDCIPVIEQVSGLKFNVDFFAGYSPERINPGDKTRCLPDIKKVTSGSTPEIAAFVDALYQTIITAGTHMAPTIKVAEAAKVIENTQRDVNIALVNELALIFHKLDIDTLDVLEAAGTKWNFLPFRPGLVGGHCIGVDPYYLTHKAQSVGYHPEVVLSGRRINDGMGSYVANLLIRQMLEKDIPVTKGTRVLIMGLTFKENCPDLRNTRVTDIIDELETYKFSVDVYDPWADPKEAAAEYGIHPVKEPELGSYDCILLAVGHKEFEKTGAAEIRKFGKDPHLFYDLKGLFDRQLTDGRL